MRDKEILVSEEEHRLLTKLREEQYQSHTPYGFILGDLVERELADG
jgi:hypothetical protein